MSEGKYTIRELTDPKSGIPAEERARAFEEMRAEREALREYRRAAERPIVADLVAAGFVIDSVWDLVNSPGPYPEALPILFEHLVRGGYPDWVSQSIGSALAVPDMNEKWDELRDLYIDARTEDEKEGLAIALVGSAAKKQFEPLLALAKDPSHGRTRIYFLKKLRRLDQVRGGEFVESVVDDSVLGVEATRLVKNSRRSAARRNAQRAAED